MRSSTGKIPRATLLTNCARKAPGERAGIRLSHTHRIFGGLFDGDINGQFGVPMFGSMKDSEPNAWRNKAEFSKVAGDISFYRPLDLSGLGAALKDVKLAYSFKGTGQYSPDLLLPTEQLTLGGFYTVRGYKTQSLSGGNGGFVRNELIYTMPYWLPDQFKSAFAQIDLFAGIDAGRSWRKTIKRTSALGRQCKRSGGWHAAEQRAALRRGLLPAPAISTAIHCDGRSARRADGAALQMVTRGASIIPTGEMLRRAPKR